MKPIHLLSLPAVLSLTAAMALAQAPANRALKNGDFSESPVGAPPAGWIPAYPGAGGVVFSDGKDTFLRLARLQEGNSGMAQVVPVPPKAKSVAVLGRMRGKPQNEKTEKKAAVEVALRYKDSKDANISAAIVASHNSPNWHTFRREFVLPPGCVKVEVVARCIFAIGTFDFDEVRVEFK